jgi:site-specific recombinase XerD
MAAAGAPLRAIQGWLGHSDYRTTSLYADYAPDLSRASYWAARAFAAEQVNKLGADTGASAIAPGSR